MRVESNLIYGNIKEIQTVDLYLPKEIKATFIYFHGGGLDRGNKTGAEKFAPYLVERGIAVASANYRLYANPKYPDRLYAPAKYPDFIRDVAKAVAFVKEYMQKNLGCDRIFVGGSSAGAYLSMMLCFDNRWLDEVGLSNLDIAGYFHDAGQPTAHFKVLTESGVDPRRIIVDETAPLYHIGLQEKYPPMRFIVSSNDMENRMEQTTLVLSTLSHFGYTGFDCVIKQGKHVEYVKKLDENGESVFGKMIYNFIFKVDNKEEA